MRAYVARAGAGGPDVPRQVRIRQEGEMWQEPGGRAMRFTATQRFAVETLAFSWRARFRFAGPIALGVVDGYEGGEGRLEARLLGIPLQRQSGPETAKGEALRYLAELPWVPHAMRANRELEWGRLDDRCVEVATQVGGERLAVTVEFRDDGDVARASSRMRLLRVGDDWVATPWAGEFRDYALLGGIRVPTRAEVYWELESGRFVYWRGRVTALERLEEPFRR